MSFKSFIQALLIVLGLSLFTEYNWHFWLRMLGLVFLLVGLDWRYGREDSTQ